MRVRSPDRRARRAGATRGPLSTATVPPAWAPPLLVENPCWWEVLAAAVSTGETATLQAVTEERHATRLVRQQRFRLLLLVTQPTPDHHRSPSNRAVNHCLSPAGGCRSPCQGTDDGTFWSQMVSFSK